MKINNPYSSLSYDPREKAKSLLVHYIQIANREPLDHDSVTGIAMIIDCIISAAEESVKQSQQPK